MGDRLVKNISWSSLAALSVAVIALAFAPIFVRFCEGEPSTITFWRTAFAVPILFMGWVFLPRQTSTVLLKPNKKAYGILILAGVIFAFNNIAWNLSLDYTTIANATLFVNFAPMIVGLLSWILFQELLPPRLLFGMLLAIMGGVLLVWPHMNTENSTLPGDALGLLAACFYGIYLLTIQMSRRYFSTFAIMTVTSIVTALTSLMAVHLFDETLVIESISHWKALIALALVVQVLGQSMIAYALARLPATLSSVFLLLQPVVATIAAMFIFDEHLHGIQWIGMVIVLFGIAATQIRRPAK